MSRTFNALGDRLLRLFLPTVEAGACIADHGQPCAYYDCYGNCR